MNRTSKRTPKTQPVQRSRQFAAATSKPDARLLDAEKFLLPTYKRQPVIMTHGRGAYVFDSAGKKYLDFLGGIAVNALGHAHPRIVKVVRREAARAIHLSNLYHNAFQGPLARRLAEWSGMDRVFFANSGTEAVDGAMKLARLFGRNPEEPCRKRNPTPLKPFQVGQRLMKYFGGEVFGFSPVSDPLHHIGIHALEVDFVKVGKAGGVLLRSFDQKPLVRFFLQSLQRILRGFGLHKGKRWGRGKGYGSGKIAFEYFQGSSADGFLHQNRG